MVPRLVTCQLSRDNRVLFTRAGVCGGAARRQQRSVSKRVATFIAACHLVIDCECLVVGDAWGRAARRDSTGGVTTST